MVWQKVKRLEKKYGDLHVVIPPLVNRYGQQTAANILGVAASTICVWLQENGYKRVTRYEREAGS